MAGNEIALIALIFVVLLLAGLLLQQAGQPVEPPTVIVQAPEAKAPEPEPRKKVDFVRARFLDNNEVDFHGEERLEVTQRRPVIVRHGNKYMCARQDEAGTWIYRQVPF